MIRRGAAVGDEERCSGRGSDPRGDLPGCGALRGRGVGAGVGDRRVLPRRHAVLRGRAGRPALHRLVRQGQDRSQVARRPREPAHGGGPVGHVRRALDLRPRPAHVVGHGGHRSARLHDGPPRAARVDRQAPRDRRAAAAGARPTAAPHQQHARRPDLHRRPRPGGEVAAAARPAVRVAGVGAAAGHARPHAGGDRPARRREPRDGEQGAGRFRPPRLAAPRRQERADPGARAPGPPRPLSPTLPEGAPSAGGAPSASGGENNWYGRTRMCHPGRHVQLVVPRRLPRRAHRTRCGAARGRVGGGPAADGDDRAGHAALRPEGDGLVRRGRAGVGGHAHRGLVRLGGAGPDHRPASGRPVPCSSRAAPSRSPGSRWSWPSSPVRP